MEEFGDDFATTICTILSRAGLPECTLKRGENSSNGLNFMASIVEMDVIAKGSCRPLENVVVKRGFTNEKLGEAFGGRICYETEEHMYGVVIPALRRFQEGKRGADVFPHVARYFGASLDSSPEIFVLENLNAEGFVVHPPKTSFDEKHMEIVFKELAGYHAANFAMREQDPDGWKALLDGNLLGRVNYFHRNEGVRNLAVSRLRKLGTAFARDGKHEMARHANNFIKNINAHIEKCTEVNSYSVIYHGDLWGCNVMFKYGNEENPKWPTDVRLLDWQASRLGHPCIDLTYLTYMSASTEVLRNLNHYMKLYYDHLSSCLRKLGSDPMTTFPYSAFREQWKTCSAYALILSLGVLCGVYIDPDEFPDFVAVVESGGDVYESVDINFRNTNEYNHKLMYVFEHLVRNNFITCAEICE